MVGWLESVTFFKASVRLKTRAVMPQIIYSQKIPYEHIFEDWLLQNKTTSCKHILAATYYINGPLLNQEITLFFSSPSHFLFSSFFLAQPM